MAYPGPFVAGGKENTLAPPRKFPLDNKPVFVGVEVAAPDPVEDETVNCLMRSASDWFEAWFPIPLPIPEKRSAVDLRAIQDRTRIRRRKRRSARRRGRKRIEPFQQRVDRRILLIGQILF